MHQWDPSKYAPHLTFPLADKYGYPDGNVYSTILPVGIYEINGSRQEKYSMTDFSAHKEFICDWCYRYDYIEVLRNTVYNHESLGTLLYYPDLEATEEATEDEPKSMKLRTDGVPVQRDMQPIPIGVMAQHSYWTYYLPAFATDIQVQPFGAEGVGYESVLVYNLKGEPYEEVNTQKYTKAKISVEYKGLARCSSVTMDQTVVPQMVYRRLPPYGFFWASDGSRVLDKEAPGKQEVKLKLTRTLKNVRKIPEVFFSLAGCINNSLIVDALTKIPFPEGTLLYSPTNLQKSTTSMIGDDDRVWSFSFELNFNPIGWNRFQRPGGVVDTIMYEGAPLEIYKPADFHDLGLDEMLYAASDVASYDPFTDACGSSIGLNRLYEDYYVLWQDVTGYVYLLQIKADGTLIVKDCLYYIPDKNPTDQITQHFSSKD